MAQVCSRCSKANPDEAAYCYYDGAVLGGNGANGGGPVNIGAQPFPSQFVFPTGQVCRNFDQLALACQQNWKAALEVLQQGYLESFLGSMGRSDLAAAAKEAARFPDRDRGLDQFLAQLPSDAVKPPKLAVEPTEINLGQLKVGEDRTLQIDLRNQGMRLVYGSISVVDCVWLAVGEGKGGRQKLFQFGDSLTIPLRVRGKQLRASHKPLVGKLSIESNAGNVEITVRAEVPVKPYPDGVFAGAKSPRQIAEKAKEKPKEAAVLFEKGAVAKWYRENGWAYPVLGPSASGLGAVQQFFEALGLTPPPKVGINKKAIALRGPAGGKVQDVIEVKAMEKRPVYAHARCDQPWVDVSKVELNGRVATIPVVIKQIPNSPGQTLKATIAIRSNGNQRFKIPLTLQVGGGGGGAFDFTTPGVATGKETVQMQGPIVAGAPMLSLARRKPPSKKHLLPALALFLALLGVVIFDFVKPAGVGAGGGGTPIFGEGKKIDFSDFDPNPIISVSFDDRERFGITMLLEKDPRNPKEAKKLTYHPKGDTNNTCIIIDGYEYRFGEGAGTWGARYR
ncbi:MAG: hypothetical protein KatS3mg105_1762 [Gemmatales bacterium]|nr:MAG: hypothetical protein KatS3mg105_1762 [Gemmatales bacterium]